MKWQADAFWHFSGKVYGLHKTRCLHLQDHYQLNVNLILVGLYLNQSNTRLSQDDWRCLIDSIADSDQQIKQLREQRRAIKAQNKDYTELLAIELNQEKKQQKLIINQLNKLNPATKNQPDNLKYYCLAQGLELDSSLIRQIAQFNNSN